MTDACVFCAIAAGTAPAKIVHQDADTVAFEALNGSAPLHVLVVPKRHIASLSELGDDELSGALLRTCVKVARDAGYTEKGYRVVTNTGADGGQSVFHLHLHVLAGRELGWPPG